jgi:acylphosphatase
MIAKHLRIHGQVQGVGYRQSMQHVARKLGLTGWVRNQSDGTVEALVCGDEAAVSQILSWIRHGPTFAQVTQVLVSEATCPETSSFNILPTE